MKITYAIFKNWLGFYIGLGIDTFEIDFTKSLHRTCLILAPNRSGKTTLLEGLTLFPDIYSSVRGSNDFIIPEKEGYRELRVQHKNTTWVSKVYWLKDRTRCYLQKYDENGGIIDLNPSGNVRSYEEQLTIEFGITKHYNNLLFLGAGLKDLILMTPGERKNNISKFTPNIEVYLQRYKETGKYFAHLKNEIQVVSSELKRMGEDRGVLERTLSLLQEKRDTLVKTVQCHKNIESQCLSIMTTSFMIQGVPITSVYERYKKDHNRLCVLLQSDNEAYKSCCIQYNIDSNLSLEEYEELYRKERDTLVTMKYRSETFSNTIQPLLNQKNSLQSIIDANTKLMEKYLHEHNMRALAKEQTELIDERSMLYSTMRHMSEVFKLNIYQDSPFTKEDSDKYLSFVNELVMKLSDIKNIYGIFVDEYIFNTFNMEEEEKLYEQLNAELKIITDTLKEREHEYEKYEQYKELSGIASLVPSQCKDDNCPFIIKAAAYTNAMSVIPSIQKWIAKATEVRNNKLRDVENQKNRLDQTFKFLWDVKRIHTFIAAYDELIVKFPDYALFNDIKSILNSPFLLPNARRFSEFAYSKERFDAIEGRLTEIKKLKDTCRDFEVKYNEQYAELTEMKKQLSAIDTEIKKLNAEHNVFRMQYKNQDEKVSLLHEIIERNKKLVLNLRKYQTSYAQIYRLKDLYNISVFFNTHIGRLKSLIRDFEEQLVQCEKELQNVRYNIGRYDEFTEKYQTLHKDYELLEVLRKTWSSTTGIPLIFIEGFMNTLLDDANIYLQELWDEEELIIDGFTIDDKSFFINVRRGGIYDKTNDASQCSGAERATLCTVLSLALLKQVPTIADMYTVARFDEIDASLDYNRSNMFVGIINNLLDTIGCEQAFMSSHNDTFQSDIDVIILKHSAEYEARMLNGLFNIIYR